jgi:hypothetical protein
MVRNARLSKRMLASIADPVIRLGTNLVKPWVYLSMTAQTTSNNPAMMSANQSMGSSLAEIEKKYTEMAKWWRVYRLGKKLWK